MRKKRNGMVGRYLDVLGNVGPEDDTIGME